MGEGILILQLKRLGDLILTAPLVASIRAQRPDVRITLMSVDAAHDLAGLIRDVDERLGFQRGRLNAGMVRHVLRAHYDLALDVTANDRSAFFTLLSGAKQRATWAKHGDTFRGRAYNRFQEAKMNQMHTVDYHLSLLESVGLKSDFKGWGLDAPPPPAGLPAEYVLIHPGTARAEKYWPAEHWVDLIRSLDLPVLISCGGDAYEVEHVRRIAEATGARVMSGQSLLGFAGLVAHASLVISVDTVTAHLAAAWERPQVTLFGPINPLQWRARHDKARILVAGHGQWVTEFAKDYVPHPMEQLKPETVRAAIRDLGFRIVRSRESKAD